MRSETVLLLHGGGALGAYECGVYKAMEEAGIVPDLVAGISIGAVNAAIIAGNRRGRAAGALEAFWRHIAVPAPPLIPHEGLRRLFAAWQIAFFGVPGFFVPRWFSPAWPLLFPFAWTSLYDPAPLRATLGRYADFDRLRSPETRLILTAVDVERGELAVFDSAERPISVDHILASGSFPPGLPWTVIDGRAYWDGGLVSNTLVAPVMEKRAGIPMKMWTRRGRSESARARAIAARSGRHVGSRSRGSITTARSSSPSRRTTTSRDRRSRSTSDTSRRRRSWLAKSASQARGTHASG